MSTIQTESQASELDTAQGHAETCQKAKPQKRANKPKKLAKPKAEGSNKKSEVIALMKRLKAATGRRS
jgi:hypothetical protein